MIVEVSARKFGIPFECPCCGATPETDLRVVARATGQGLDVPYCRRCVAHVRKHEGSGVPSAALMVIGIVVVFVLAAVETWWVGVLTFIAVAVIAWFVRASARNAARAGCGESCAAPGIAVTYLGWSGGTSSFSFDSPTFAARFAEQNTAILSNPSPQLRKLLDGYRKARLAVPTPAVAAGVAPPPLTFPEWLARLESTEGTFARRVALGRALEMIEEAHQRRELLQMVARIELAPVLAQLQRVDSSVAKRDMLQRALDEVRGENISEELEAVQVEQLQARLDELR